MFCIADWHYRLNVVFKPKPIPGSVQLGGTTSSEFTTSLLAFNHIQLKVKAVTSLTRLVMDITVIDSRKVETLRVINLEYNRFTYTSAKLVGELNEDGVYKRMEIKVTPYQATKPEIRLWIPSRMHNLPMPSHESGDYEFSHQFEISTSALSNDLNRDKYEARSAKHIKSFLEKMHAKTKTLATGYTLDDLGNELHSDIRLIGHLSKKSWCVHALNCTD